MEAKIIVIDFSKPYNYEDVAFEIKHVKILNEKQETIFEDDNRIFKKIFDNNAAAIVASRYLCK